MVPLLHSYIKSSASAVILQGHGGSLHIRHPPSVSGIGRDPARYLSVASFLRSSLSICWRTSLQKLIQLYASRAFHTSTPTVPTTQQVEGGLVPSVDMRTMLLIRRFSPHPSRGSAIVSDVVQYVQPTASAYEPDGGVCYVIVFDGNIPPADIYSVIRIFRSMVQADTLQRDDSIGLIVFNSTVSIYQLGLSAGVASADIYSGDPHLHLIKEWWETILIFLTGPTWEAWARGGLDALERWCGCFLRF